MFNDRLKLARLKDIKSAFINNLKRYFLLDEYSFRSNRTNNKNGSYNIWNNTVNTWTRIFFNRINWGSGCLYPINRTSERKSRPSKNHDRKTIFKNRQKAFFIDRTEQHYGILRTRLIELVQDLEVFQGQERFMTEWIREFERTSQFSDRINQLIQNHMIVEILVF